jgi:phage tail-like protein
MAIQKERAYAAAHFALELDGKKDVGLFRSIEGGGVRADVMNYQYGTSLEKWRQVGKPKFEDIKLQVGMAMTKPFYDWIAKFFEGEAIQKTGAIVAADFRYAERARREFSGAMIKELTFPALSAKDNNPAYMNLTLAVEDMKFSKGSGATILQNKGMRSQKDWASNRFRFSLDGFDSACRNVSKIDAFTIKQTVIDYHSGGFRAPIKCASAMDFPNIAFYIPEADAQPLFDQVKKRVVDGELKSHTDKKAGYIQTYNTEAQAKTLVTLEFYDAEIIAVTPDKSDAGTDEFKMVKVELYTERMRFTYPAMEAE